MKTQAAHFDLITSREPTRYRAARLAVMPAFLVPADTPYHSQEAYDKLREVWHARLYALNAAEWNRLDTFKKLLYMQNCPPFGVITRTKTRQCKQIICPFCYARQCVLEHFWKIEKLLYQDGIKSLSKLVRPELKVLAFRAVGRPILSLPPVSHDNAKEHCSAIRAFIQKTRRREVDEFKPECASVCNFSYAGATHLVMRRSGVLIVKELPSQRKLNDYLGKFPKVKIELFEKISKQALLTAFVFAFRYPRALFSSDPGIAARILEANHGAHRMSWYGSQT